MADTDLSATETVALLRASSLSRVIERDIERMILGGAVRPGERLNEKALADRFGTSRGPVREACQALGARHMVVGHTPQLWGINSTL